jgi:hypothetical protein
MDNENYWFRNFPPPLNPLLTEEGTWRGVCYSYFEKIFSKT